MTAGGDEVARGVVGLRRTALSRTDRTERKEKRGCTRKRGGERACACLLMIRGRAMVFIRRDGSDKTSTLRKIVSKGYQKIRKINQPATIPHGDVIKEHSALRFEGKERCIEGATAGARSTRRRCLCLDRRLDKERKDKRGALAIGEGDKRHVRG